VLCLLCWRCLRGVYASVTVVVIIIRMEELVGYMWI
jgi:hypothetical protein